MPSSLRTVGALLAVCLLGLCAEAKSARSDAASDADAIGRVIAQLGDEQYSVRHRAEQQLIDWGAAAFDQVLAAAHHPDLEVASRASYLLPRLRIDWVRGDDPAELRELIQSYGELSRAERREKIGQLAALDAGLGLAALCRIARYDATSTIACEAALEILASGKATGGGVARRIEVVERETGSSPRRPVEWIRRHYGLRQQSAGAESGWLGLVDAEIALHQKGSNQTNADVVFRLLKYYLGECQGSEKESAFEPLRRMIDLRVDEGGTMHNALVFSLSWTTTNEQWRALAQLEDRYGDRLQEDRLLLYMVAEAAARQGDSERAKELAEEAYQLNGEDAQKRYGVANMIAELGRHDWAEREWQYLIDHLADGEVRSLYARRDLANMRLYDRGEYQKAADMVGEALSAIDQQIGEDKKKKREFGSKAARQWLGQFRSLRDYFLSCQEETKGNFEQQRKFLESAYQGDKENPDVLIAMYRLSGADEAYQKLTSKRIQTLAKKLEADIEGNPDSPGYYNHWAWLIGNTEGDFEKAVAYSHRSLEVKPKEQDGMGTLDLCYSEMRAIDLVAASPSYLDTLGRCYYAAGDLDNAIKYQKQAIARHPHLAVMRRQLALFERELAARDAK